VGTHEITSTFQKVIAGDSVVIAEELAGAKLFYWERAGPCYYY
jgi:hypothetical protein